MLLRRSTLWGHPGLSHGTFDDVPLNSFAFRTSKRSQVLAKRARLNRRQPHGRTASRALRALVLCVEHVLAPSVRSPEFPGKPPCGSRFHRVARDDLVLYGVALGAFEPAMLKAHRTRASTGKHHAGRAARTARALDGCERWAGGKTSFWHDTSLHLDGSVQHSQVTDGCRYEVGDGTSMRLGFRSRWSIQLTFQKKLTDD
jgi:hypothetical protein